jgi:hypothetical protein
MPSLMAVAIFALIVVGAFLVVEGVRTLLNRSPDIDHDSALDKKLLSPYTRYWIGRYYSGFQLLGSGIGILLLAAFLYLEK